MRRAARRAAAGSSSARTSAMWTMSVASMSVTYVPERGRTSTRPSSARRLTASRSGVRPSVRLRMSSSSRSAVPGGRRERDDEVAHRRVGALGEEAAVAGHRPLGWLTAHESD